MITDPKVLQILQGDRLVVELRLSDGLNLSPHALREVSVAQEGHAGKVVIQFSYLCGQLVDHFVRPFIRSR